MKTPAIDFRIHLLSTETAAQTNHPNKNQDEKEPNSTKWEEEMYARDIDSTFTLLAHHNQISARILMRTLTCLK